MDSSEINKMDNLKEKSVAVIGGLGFIGSNTAIAFYEQGANVKIIDACLDPYGWNFANIRDHKEKIKFVKGDARDKAMLEAELKDADVVLNFAAQVGHSESIQDPFFDVELNIKLPLAVLEASRKVCDKAKIMFASTRGVIGKLEYSPIDEKHPTEPTDINGINKLATEKYHSIYNKIYGLNTTSLRINNTYGERHQMKHSRYGIINWFIRKAMLNEPIEIYGEGNQTRDYNYVGDVANAFLLAAVKSSESNGKTYNLGSGKETKLIEAAETIVKTVGNGSIKKIPWPEEKQKIEIGNFFVTYQKIKSELGWEPTVSFENGIKTTVDFYRERKNDYF